MESFRMSLHHNLPEEASLQCAYFMFLLFSFCRGNRECWKTHVGSMQQQPGDGCDHVPRWRWHHTGAQHQLKCGSIEQQSSPFRVHYFITMMHFLCTEVTVVGLEKDTLSLWYAIPEICECLCVFQWSASAYSPKAGHTGGTRTVIWR